MMTRKKFLEDTIAFYSEDVGRRAKGTNTCKYKTLDGRKCAIGRWIPESLYFPGLEGKDLISNDLVFGILPGEIKELGRNFLNDIQHLHDLDRFWTPFGLSTGGQLRVKYIKEKYEID